MEQYQRSYNNNNNQLKVIKYQYIEDFHEGLAAIEQKKHWGYINTQGEIVIPCQYDLAMIFSEGLAMVSQDHNEGYIDQQGNLIIPLKYFDAEDFREGLAAVSDDEGEMFGYIDKTDELIIPFQYEFADSFYEGLATVGKTIKGEFLMGFINQQGKTIIDYKYQDAQRFKNGFAQAVTSTHLVVINKQGEEVFKITDNEINMLEAEGEIVLCHQGTDWQFLNLLTGLDTMLPKDIESLAFIKDGLCFMANTKGKRGALDKDAQIVIPFIYDNLEQPNEGTIPFLKDGAYGFLDYNGKIILPQQYDTAEAFGSGLAKVSKDKKEFFINQKGEIAFYIKRKEESKSIVIIIGIILFWIALIVLVLL